MNTTFEIKHSRQYCSLAIQQQYHMAFCLTQDQLTIDS